MVSGDIENPYKEAEALLKYLLGIDNVSFYKKLPEKIPDEIFLKYKSLLFKRLARYPLQYILQEVEFYSLTLKVIPGVFIPRPETELLVDEVLNIVKKHFTTKKLQILDLGTGTGAILLSLLKEIPLAQGIGIDINPLALSLSYQNAFLNGLKDRVIFLERDIFSPDQFTISKKFDIIVSNPPYIPDEEINELQPEIKEEPITALLGGKNGLMYYPYIFKWCIKFLDDNGFLVFEMGRGEWEEIKKIAFSFGFKNMYMKRDLNGIERIGIVWKKENLKK